VARTEERPPVRKDQEWNICQGVIHLGWEGEGSRRWNKTTLAECEQGTAISCLEVMNLMHYYYYLTVLANSKLETCQIIAVLNSSELLGRD
jgi:hypothetical protein